MSKAPNISVLTEFIIMGLVWFHFGWEYIPLTWMSMYYFNRRLVVAVRVILDNKGETNE